MERSGLKYERFVEQSPRRIPAALIDVSWIRDYCPDCGLLSLDFKVFSYDVRVPGVVGTRDLNVVFIIYRELTRHSL